MKDSFVLALCRGPVVHVCCSGGYCFDSFDVECTSQRAAVPILRKNGWLVRYVPEYGFYRCYCPDCRKDYETRGRKAKVIFPSVGSDSGDGAV